MAAARTRKTTAKKTTPARSKAPTPKDVANHAAEMSARQKPAERPWSETPIWDALVRDQGDPLSGS